MKLLSLQNLTSNWNLFKILKLSLGLLVLIQSVQAHDAVMGLFGGLFMGQALLNVGCCGPNGCGVPTQTKTDTKNTPITFTEIKSSEEE